MGSEMKFQQKAIALLAFIAVSLLQFSVSAATKKAAPPSTPWTPTPFNTDATQLPPNYKGLDVKRVWLLIKSKAQTFEKGEFETTEEFQQRLSSSARSLSPLSADEEYAFFISSLTPKYNADTQQYEISDYGFCQKTLELGENKGWATCVIGELERKRDEYVGSNAYGAKAHIDRTIGKDFAIAVPTDTGFLFSNLFERDKYSQYSSFFNLKTNFSLPLEKARSLQNQKIGVLLVGKFTMAKIIDGRAVLIDPTITKPSDIFITQDAVPFSPSRVVYYVIQTGEILSSQSL